MAYTLRPYQQEAVDATITHFRKTNDAAVIVLPTGAGKSLVIAELARLAKRRILVLTHVKELVQQNHEKYESYGLSASVFSAGLNRKENHHQVIFGSVQSVANSLDRFSNEFSLLIIDECHRVAVEDDSQYQQVIAELQQFNPDLKILGLTATPYRLDTGWIYQWHKPDNRIGNSEPSAFRTCIYELPLRYMISNGYLTQPQLIDAPVAFYDFDSLREKSASFFREEDLNQVVQRSSRATNQIIEQIVDLAKDRHGVMIFAATVMHAKEIMGYLPPECSALILGNMRATARDSVIHAFKQRHIKFLVNVSVLTTGFDAPHVDVIALLRPTESVGLYQQIVGRGLRLAKGKEDCLILDYAGNTHDLYRPQIDSPKPSNDSQIVNITCPLCEHINVFWGKTDGDGHIIEHYGRRCQGVAQEAEIEKSPQQCEFRFRFKECDQCGAENDIAARQCHQCEKILVDPDTKLKEALKLRDLTVIRCSGMQLSAGQDSKQNPQLVITYHDEDGAQLQERFSFSSASQRGAFYHKFVRQHTKLAGAKLFPQSVTEALQIADQFRAPDFVIARKQKRFWTIREKLFDYNGAYRRAHQLS